MKKLFLSLISMAIAGSAYAIPNTFKEGDVISAEQMNENFQYLEQQFRGSRATIVDCGTSGTGSGINEAIAQGFNDITVSGTCNENLVFSIWNNDASSSSAKDSSLTNRFLKITGTTSDTKIVDTSQNTEAVIYVEGATTVFLKNLTLEGGNSGVRGVRNSTILLEDVEVRDFTARGIGVVDSSFLGSKGSLTIKGNSAAYGIILYASSGWQEQASISGVGTGVASYAGSHFFIAPSFEIQAENIGIDITNGSVVEKWGDSNGAISNTKEAGIRVKKGTLHYVGGNLEIKNLQSGPALQLEDAKAEIHNLNMPDFENTGSGWNPAISVDINSSLELENAVISGSTDGPFVSIEEGSVAHFRESTLTIGGNGIEVFGSSRFNFQNSTISGSSAGSLVSISDGSSAKIQDSTIETNSADNVLIVSGTSRLELNESQVTGNVTNNIINIVNGSSAGIHDSTIDMTNGDWGTAILISAASTLTTGGTEITSNKIGLYVERNSFADFGSGSSIKAGRLYTAGAVVGSSGMRIRPGSGMSSEGAAAMEIKNSSYVLAMDGANIDRTDVGVDVEIGQMSSLTIWGSDIVGEVTCWGRSLVFPQNGAIITNLDSNCSE